MSAWQAYTKFFYIYTNQIVSAKSGDTSQAQYLQLDHLPVQHVYTLHKLDMRPVGVPMLAASLPCNAVAVSNSGSSMCIFCGVQYKYKTLEMELLVG